MLKRLTFARKRLIRDRLYRLLAAFQVTHRKLWTVGLLKKSPGHVIVLRVPNRIF